MNPEVKMPKLNLKEYKCQHKSVKALDNSTKYKNCILNCLCYDIRSIHKHDIIYQKGECRDCLQKFIIRTINRIPKDNSKISSSSKFMSITKCLHPHEALHINENSIKEISTWWSWFFSRSNESCIKASGECLLCDSQIHVQRKCTGVIKENKQVQIWSNWIIT